MPNGLIWIIIGMGLVTYTPRMLPFVFIKTDGVPPFIQAVLKNVPFAVLGALIFPGIFIIQSGHLQTMSLNDLFFGLIGGGMAFVAAILDWNIVFVVLSAIAVLAVYSIFF